MQRPARQFDHLACLPLLRARDGRDGRLPRGIGVAEAVPHEVRTGAIVKGENRLPVRERSYRKWFQAIARAAGLPDEVWSMDSRAGAATEADEAGADLAAISDMLTHAEPRTTLRYIRRREKRIEAAAEARVKSRPGGGDAREQGQNELSERMSEL